jgi:hypothetical protein
LPTSDRAGKCVDAMINALATEAIAPTAPGAHLVSKADPSLRPIVVVLGMHRSGTSLCAHVLSCLGVDMADDRLVNLGNAKGHWERLELMALHDRILDRCNRTYSSPLHDLTLPPGWWADPEVQAIKREIIAFLRQRIGAMPFGFKDPRTARLMPMWYQIFGELGLAPKFVLCLRNPAQVARSLCDRDRLEPRLGEYRWFVYLTDIFRFIGQHGFCLIEYEHWFTEPERNLAKLQEFLSLDWAGSETDLRLSILEIVDQELRHDDPRAEVHEPTVRWFYDLVRAFPTDTTAERRVHALVSQFTAYRTLQRPLERVFEHAIASAGRVVPLEACVANLQQAAEAKAAELERLRGDTIALQTELHARDAALIASQHAGAEQKAVIDRLTAELTALADAQRSAAEHAAAADTAQAELAELRVEMAAREAALLALRQICAEGQAAAERHEAELALLRAELADRDTALAAAEGNAVEKAAAAQAELAVRRAEVTVRDTALAEAERRSEEQATAAAGAATELARAQAELLAQGETLAAAQAHAGQLAEEVASLRRQLDAAARGAQAAVTTATADLEALRAELAVARQTAAATIAALRADFGAPAPDRGDARRARLWWRGLRSGRPHAITQR